MHKLKSTKSSKINKAFNDLFEELYDSNFILVPTNKTNIFVMVSSDKHICWVEGCLHKSTEVVENATTMNIHEEFLNYANEISPQLSEKEACLLMKGFIKIPFQPNSFLSKITQRKKMMKTTHLSW